MIDATRRTSIKGSLYAQAVGPIIYTKSYIKAYGAKLRSRGENQLLEDMYSYHWLHPPFILLLLKWSNVRQMEIQNTVLNQKVAVFVN